MTNHTIYSQYQDKRKELDYGNKLVTTFFGKGYSKEMIADNINSSLMSRLSSYSPKIIDYNVENKYMLEELVSGKELSPCSVAEIVNAYHSYINPFLSELICADYYTEINSSDYYTELEKRLETCMSGLTLIDSRFEPLQDMLKQVVSSPTPIDIPILLVPSHGDFKFKHVILASTGAKVIDWETFGRRSFLLDFMNPISGWLYHNHHSGIKTWYDQCISEMVTLVEKHNPIISKSIGYWQNNPAHAVFLFYMERLVRLVEATHTGYDTKLLGIDRLLYSVKIMSRELK